MNKTIVAFLFAVLCTPQAQAMKSENNQAESNSQGIPTLHPFGDVEKNENNYLALNRLGVMARKEGQFTKAERLYLDAIDAWPGNPASYYNLGILYDLYMGKKKKALKNYEKYAALINNPLIGEVDKKASKEIARWIADLRRQLPAIDEERLND